MSFQVILKKLMESVPGAIGAVFADYEGESVDQVSRNGDSYHVRFMGAHYGILLESTKRISTATDTGKAMSLTIKTEKIDYFTAPVYDGYFVVLAVDTGSPPVRAYLALDRAIQSLRIEMGY